MLRKIVPVIRRQIENIATGLHFYSAVGKPVDRHEKTASPLSRVEPGREESGEEKRGFFASRLGSPMDQKQPGGQFSFTIVVAWLLPL